MLLCPGTRSALASRLVVAVSVRWLLAGALMTVTVILHPVQPVASSGWVAYRRLDGLQFAPLTTVGGVLYVRYAPGTSISPLLILMAVGHDRAPRSVWATRR